MSVVMVVAAIALGAALGGLLRYWFAVEMPFPWATVAVNIVATFVLALLMFIRPGMHPAVAAGVVTGLCGALSTWSTQAKDLLEAQRRSAGLAVAVWSVLGLGTVAAVVAANAIAQAYAGLG